MKKFIILLRGVMPKGKNKVPMALLRDALGKVGLENVQTYIQSGNVIASSNRTQVDTEELVHSTISEKFGGNISVLARTPQQFTSILECVPFKEVDTKKLYFTLLAKNPDKLLLKKFISIDHSPDHIVYENNVIYTLYNTKHSDSKFNNNYFERKLKVTMTSRNFNTMNKLVELANAQQEAQFGLRR
ncbi:MAG: DUF1697 domain-containing protein [Candidatus Thiodiazotropha sp.]|nr:DUF1697 domain-containing protein [Candidatus Thiodiazotropha taylori]MBT3058395.1 DUF1697 domain-containing protein [Candidatus Thiodiazotropha sp. (ex Lucina pensylvanica)]MBT3061449.1 DUF1697 domain-containing protein [Candidatus Thiodiazotropha sp. (ex Lucina pensylvanica)]PUB74776.1 MAG: hypothetical protein DBP03_08640 [gamma proteobacterium symbiont of Ctena orbiculata]